MAVKVKLNYVRHSARKLRPVLKSFVGQMLEMAIDKTSVMAPDSARLLNKVLKMAQSAAQEKQFDSANMVVDQLFAGVGPAIKRSRANARGRTNRYVKHLAHITVILKENKEKNVHAKTPIATKGKIETKVRSKKG